MSARVNRRLAQLTAHLLPSLQPEQKIALNDVSGSSKKKPVNVVVTGAAGNIAYSIIFMIGQGAMLGPDQPINFRLLDIPQMVEKVKGVEMELRDCAFPIVHDIVSTGDYETAFKNADVCLLIGARPRGPGMERKDLLTANASIFAGQGKAINQFASRNVKVLVVGNPANTNAMIAMNNAPDIPKENFTAMTRLDQNRAVALVSERTKVPVKNVKNVIIWGNHSKTQYPDINHAFIDNNGTNTPVRTAVNDNKFLDGPFLATVQDRGAAIIKARGLSSAASAANAAVDHIRSWMLGTPKGEYVSMGVCSDGSYGVPKGLIYSFPVTCSKGTWKIVQGLKINDFSKEKMKLTAEELIAEKNEAGYGK